jgi:hypothetical protein
MLAFEEKCGRLPGKHDLDALLALRSDVLIKILNVPETLLPESFLECVDLF